MDSPDNLSAGFSNQINSRLNIHASDFENQNESNNPQRPPQNRNKNFKFSQRNFNYQQNSMRPSQPRFQHFDNRFSNQNQFRNSNQLSNNSSNFFNRSTLNPETPSFEPSSSNSQQHKTLIRGQNRRNKNPYKVYHVKDLISQPPKTDEESKTNPSISDNNINTSDSPSHVDPPPSNFEVSPSTTSRSNNFRSSRGRFSYNKRDNNFRINNYNKYNNYKSYENNKEYFNDNNLKEKNEQNNFDKNKKKNYFNKKNKNKINENWRVKKNEIQNDEKDNGEKKEDEKIKKNKILTEKKDEEEKEEEKNKKCIENGGQKATLEEQLTNGNYECMICFFSIKQQAATWNCSNCFHVFHLYCIKKWSTSLTAQVVLANNNIINNQENEINTTISISINNSTSIQIERRNEEAEEEEEERKMRKELRENKNICWRCPACQNVCKGFPDCYICFCGKKIDPPFTPGLMPHSCGEICGKKKSALCPHLCTSMCHPGPCPPCPVVIRSSCFCGKIFKQIRCSDKREYSCNQACNKLLNCSIHYCSNPCHPSPCQPCQLPVNQECFCKKENRSVICGTKLFFEKSFSCKGICGILLNCKNHNCELICHLPPCPPCPLTPGKVTHCPCGKTPLKKLVGELERKEMNNEEFEEFLKNGGRKSCLDKIICCDQICGKELKCGEPNNKHLCKLKCHSKSCPACEKGITKADCRCGSSLEEVECEIYVEKGGMILCGIRCSRKLSCRRHRCLNTCCVDKDHICILKCGRKLTCGLHKCEDQCHRGNCGVCWRVSFEELSCYCGYSVLYPPIPCGTPPPPCLRTCTRSHPCDHPINHSCHSEPSCPPCTFLTTKKCFCGKTSRSNIPCFIQDISCGLPCSKGLPCILHHCLKICHKPPCLKKCTQLCPIPRPLCGHPCNLPCHFGTPCPPSTCQWESIEKCECGLREGKVTCLQVMTTENKVDYASYFAKSITNSFNFNSLNLKKNQNKKQIKYYPCGDECAKQKRNLKLASALNIQTPKNPDPPPSDPPEQINYSQFLVEYGKKNEKFVTQVEKEFEKLVILTQKLTPKDKNITSRRLQHWFKVMPPHQRRVIHELSLSYGCESESFDEEPNRSVTIFATKGVCLIPRISLMSVVRSQLSTKTKPLARDEMLKLASLPFEETEKKMTSLKKINQSEEREEKKDEEEERERNEERERKKEREKEEEGEKK